MTEPFKGLALGVFLITVGMSLGLRFVAANWVGLGGAVIGVVAIKTAVTFGLLRFRLEEHTSELQSLMRSSYAVFCLKNKNSSSPRPTRSDPQPVLYQQVNDVQGSTTSSLLP